MTALYLNPAKSAPRPGKIGDANVPDVRDAGDEIEHIVDREVKLGEVQARPTGPRFTHAATHWAVLAFGDVPGAGRPGSFRLYLAAKSALLICAVLAFPKRFWKVPSAANQVIFDDRRSTCVDGTAEEFGEFSAHVVGQGFCAPSKLKERTCSRVAERNQAHRADRYVCWCGAARRSARTEGRICSGRRAERIAPAEDFLLLRRAAERLSWCLR